MSYPKTVCQVTEYSHDERVIKRYIFETEEAYNQHRAKQPTNVYFIDADADYSELEELFQTRNMKMEF